jgi:DNA repair photolyase
LVGNRPSSIESWIEKVMATEEYNYRKGNQVALKERIPLKIGANSDPFPYIEKKERFTLKVLKLFGEYDYPLEIQTKNPGVLASYIDEFKDVNWNIAVSITTNDTDFCNFVEPHAPPLEKRYRAIKQLTDVGINVMIKIQPTFYRIIFDELEGMVKRFRDAGCWSFNTEGLKIRRLLSKNDKQHYIDIGEYLDYDILDFYRMEDSSQFGSSETNDSDLELNRKKKMKYTKLAIKLANKYGLKYYTADNFMGNVGDGDECCGTEVLRDYKLHDLNFRTQAFGKKKNGSEKFRKCVVNFTRATSKQKKQKQKTIEEYYWEKKEKIDNILRQKTIQQYFA